MGKAKTVTPRKRAIVVQYIKDGVKQSEICKKLTLSKSVVSRIASKFWSSGTSEAGKSTGRPRITTRREDNTFRRCAVINPTYSSQQIKVETCSAASTRTIRRRLFNEFGLRACKPAKKPLLNHQQRVKRKKFCRKYLHWSPQDWSRVLFSDESTFQQFNSSATYVRRPSGQRYHHRFTIPTMKHPAQIMVWGSFSAGGRGSLYFVDQNKKVNAAEYLNILQNKLLLTMRLHSCSIFQQDSAPSHTARVVKGWLAANNVQVLDWPGNSPDLNQIENLWMLLKRKVRKYHAKNIPELMYYIKRAWCTEMSADICKRLIFSMPKRLRQVLHNKGYATKY